MTALPPSQRPRGASAAAAAPPEDSSGTFDERQRVERALAEERERLRITLGSIGDGVISTDAAGRVVFLNRVAEQLTGWPQAEAAGRPLAEVFRIVNERTRAPVENPALQALAQGRVVDLANHTLLVARDGSERPIDDSAAPMWDAAGATIGAVLVFRDVSERKRADHARAQLAAIVESSDDAIVSKTLDGVIRSWNLGATRLFGYSSEEAIGQHITLLIPPDRVDEEVDILARLQRGERVEHFETVRIAKDGRRLAISLTVSPVRDAEGRVVGASKIARDITDRKRAEAVLRDTADRLALALAAARLGDWSWEIATDLVTFSDRAAEIFGVTPDPQRTWTELRVLIHPADQEHARLEVELALAARAQYDVEYRLARADGTQIWVSAVGHAQYLPDGTPLRMFGVVQDITERKRLEQELRWRATELAEADRKKDDFIALLAHELRNPLAPLRSGLQVMRLAADDADAVAKTRAMMDRQLTHMVRLIDDLLDVSRMSRGKFNLQRTPVALEEVVAHALEAAGPALEAAGHQLEVSLPPYPVMLDADLTRLAQVFGNLLANSAKYTAPGGRIWLTARRDGHAVEVSIRDTGIGIPPDALPHVFDMFSQVDRSVERATGGLGIGLALVKGLVETHGGTVTAESPGPGRGSTFTVRLPVSAARPAPAPVDPAGHTRSVRTGMTVLVADDSHDGVASMAALLELLGHEVHVALDGVHAVEMAERVRPDLVLMDIGMPRLDGLEATRQIRQRPWGRAITIIALTGWGQAGDRERSRAAGCDGHFVKPVSLGQLETLFGELAERSAASSR